MMRVYVCLCGSTVAYGCLWGLVNDEGLCVFM